MRAFFEVPEWWPRDAADTTTDTIFRLHSVDITDCAEAAKRDFVFRAFRNEAIAPNAKIYAFRNYADASTATVVGDSDDLLAANKVIASASMTAVGGTLTGQTMSDNTNYGQTTESLRINYSGTMGDADWDRYYNYTSNIGDLTLRKIVAVLKEYNGEAGSLEEFDDFGIEYAREGRKSRKNQILVRYGDIESAVGSQGLFSQTIQFICRVYMVKKAEGVENDAMIAANRIQSILGDERRKLDSFVNNVWVTMTDITEPEQSDYPNEGDAGIQCELTGFVRYKDVQFMDINL